MIRTCDLIVPSDALFQAELHPDIGEIWKNRTFFFAATTQRSAFELISPGGSSQNRTASSGSSDQRAHQLRQRSKLFGYTTEWCGIRGSNPNVLRPLILSQCCLPIPAIPHKINNTRFLILTINEYLAEGLGFEPRDRFRDRRFSRPLQ